MTTSPRNNLTLHDTLHGDYFCPFCGENSYNGGKVKSCRHLKYIWRQLDGDSENALIYVTEDVRNFLARENVDHYQMWEVLCLEPPFENCFVIEENWDSETSEWEFDDDVDWNTQTLAIAWQMQ